MAWHYHSPGDGGGRRKCTAGSRSQILFGTYPHLLLRGIPFLQQRYHTPVGTGSPLVLQPGHWFTNLAICILFWVIFILNACLRSTNCTSFVCEFCLSRFFSGFFQLFSDWSILEMFLLTESEDAERCEIWTVSRKCQPFPHWRLTISVDLYCILTFAFNVLLKSVKRGNQ